MKYPSDDSIQMQVERISMALNNYYGVGTVIEKEDLSQNPLVVLVKDFCEGSPLTFLEECGHIVAFNSESTHIVFNFPKELLVEEQIAWVKELLDILYPFSSGTIESQTSIKHTMSFIAKVASNANMTMDELFEECGHQLLLDSRAKEQYAKIAESKRFKLLEAIKAQLKKSFGTSTTVSVDKMGQPLYTKINEYAKTYNVTFSTVIAQCGYSLANSSKTAIQPAPQMKNLSYSAQLDAIYGKGNSVHALASYSKQLYNSMTKEAHHRGISFAELCSQCGHQYIPTIEDADEDAK